MALEQSQNQNSRWSVAGVFLLKLGLVVLLACAAAVAYLALRSHDPVYVLREFKDASGPQTYACPLAGTVNAVLCRFRKLRRETGPPQKGCRRYARNKCLFRN